MGVWVEFEDVFVLFMISVEYGYFMLIWMEVL